MNAYTALTAAKSPSVLDIQHNREDDRILAIIESASRQIDGFCGRTFYVANATLTLDCEDPQTLFLPDLISVDANGIATDDVGDDGDGAFKTVWTDTDFDLRPPNADPDGGADSARPYRSIRASRGSVRRFPVGGGRVKIAGQWGFWRRLGTATETLSGAISATDGQIAVSANADVSPGHTLLIGAEQLYVRRLSAANAFQVQRAVNGTMAAAHQSGDAIRIFEYPAPIREAATIQTARTWRGQPASLGADLRETLGAYRRYELGNVSIP